MSQKVMVDEEIENILAEIRARVRAQELPSAITNAPQTNRDGERPIPLEASGEDLARIDSYLTVTSRAWDRLPPLASNRSGTLEQIELWVKRLIKRATRWFTWEQINFNAAVHHALQEVDQALSAYEHALEGLRAEAEGNREMLEQSQLALKAQSVTQLAEQRKEMDARFSEISQLIHARFDHLHEEQRVCFKQLSLEATEAAVLEDRARRKSEKLLEELKRRVEQIEKSHE